MRTVGNIGELYALQPLDFEDPAHRRGFRFMVQVTDRVSCKGQEWGGEVVGGGETGEEVGFKVFQGEHGERWAKVLLGRK